MTHQSFRLRPAEPRDADEIASRGQGIGRALVAAAMEWAKRERCVRTTVTSAEHRAAAHAFYAKCGLPYTGRRFSAVLDAPEDQS